MFTLISIHSEIVVISIGKNFLFTLAKGFDVSKLFKKCCDFLLKINFLQKLYSFKNSRSGTVLKSTRVFLCTHTAL